MSMTITYEVGQSLYLNLTNRCSNDCQFCIRKMYDGVGSEDNLWLDREPTVAEVKQDIQQRDLTAYREFVFCGYGEPMMRADDVIEICKWLKENYDLPIRINTNGQANLIHGRDITPLLEGLVDTISISMNAKDKAADQAVCHSTYGDEAYEAMLDFAVKSKQYVPEVVLSVVDCITREDIEACREIAKGRGLGFRVRHYLKHAS